MQGGRAFWGIGNGPGSSPLRNCRPKIALFPQNAPRSAGASYRLLNGHRDCQPDANWRGSKVNEGGSEVFVGLIEAVNPLGSPSRLDPKLVQQSYGPFG